MLEENGKAKNKPHKARAWVTGRMEQRSGHVVQGPPVVRNHSFPVELVGSCDFLQQ